MSLGEFSLNGLTISNSELMEPINFILLHLLIFNHIFSAGIGMPRFASIWIVVLFHQSNSPDIVKTLSDVAVFAAINELVLRCTVDQLLL